MSNSATDGTSNTLDFSTAAPPMAALTPAKARRAARPRQPRAPEPPCPGCGMELAIYVTGADGRQTLWCAQGGATTAAPPDPTEFSR